MVLFLLIQLYKHTYKSTIHKLILNENYEIITTYIYRLIKTKYNNFFSGELQN